MNKKANTLLFILGATVVNVLVTLVLFVALFVLVGYFLAPVLPESVTSILVMVVFIASIAGTYFIYHAVVKLLAKKIDMEKYFDPIFRTRRKP